MQCEGGPVHKRGRGSVAKQNYTNKHEFVVLAVLARQ